MLHLITYHGRIMPHLVELWFLLLSPLLVFEFDLSLLCNTNTLRNILMMLGTS